MLAGTNISQSEVALYELVFIQVKGRGEGHGSSLWRSRGVRSNPCHTRSIYYYKQVTVQIQMENNLFFQDQTVPLFMFNVMIVVIGDKCNSTVS